MADAKSTIELVFEGVDNTGQAVQSVLRGTRNLSGDIQAATQPIADFTTNALRLEAEDYKNLARELSVEYGVAATEVLDAIASYKQAGFTAQEAGELTKIGLDAVIAGGTEASQTADQLVASIRGFGAEASDAAGIVDLLNEVSNNYNATFEQLFFLL